MWADEYMREYRRLGGRCKPTEKALDIALCVAIVEQGFTWCPTCATFRTGLDCEVCKARKALDEYTSETARIAQGIDERRLPKPREHTDPPKPAFNHPPGQMFEGLQDALDEAWELKRLALAYDRAKKERRKIRRLLDERESGEGTAARSPAAGRQ